MKNAFCAFLFCILILSAPPANSQVPQASLRGTVTDPSGATVPAALVQIVGPRGEQRQGTGDNGQYLFPGLPSGKYQIRFIAKGFAVGQKQNVEVNAAVTVDYQLSIEANATVVNVEATANEVSVDPGQNGDAISITGAQIDALSDDPDLLQQQLLALAGGAGGPNGGQIYVDGFSGAQLPPKASIQEIRINSNPYSPENEFAGGSGIQIITKPGTSTLHGGVNFYYNKEALNSRSPLLTQAKRPQFKQEQLFGNFSGKLIKNKASWSANFTRNNAVNNSFIYATTLDSLFNPVQVNQTALAPRGNWNWTGRVDYALNAKNTLMVSFFNGHNHARNLGVGDFSLLSRGYNNHGNNNQLQMSETAILSARMVSDTRFQWFRSLSQSDGDNTVPTIVVPGAFTGGGAQIGHSGSISTTMELNSSTSFAYKAHTLRWGGRLREALINNTSVSNFGGTYTFQGGNGPVLDGLNQPIAGTSTALTALDVYRRTLIFQAAGFNDTDIRLRGGGAYQFSLSGGQPTIHVKQFDAGLFWVDDWRARPNVTFSYGLRYETQTNISTHGDFAPRVAVAWNVGKKGKPSKTVVRAGFGAFYSRVQLGTIQNALRFNGVTQQSFLIASPAFFPSIPSTASLTTGKLPQQIQIVDSSIRGPQNWQGSIGADRQVTKAFRFSANFSMSRGIHLQRSRNINAPLPGTFTIPGTGVFPFGDTQIRSLTESTGFSRTKQFTVTPTYSYKTMFLAGYYTMSFGRSDADGQPSDPYNLRSDWGPSGYADTRHRGFILLSTPLPTKWLKKFSVSGQLSAQSGSPYSLTIGRDLNGDAAIAERPGLVSGASAASCTGVSLVFKPGFGCFNLNPAPGTAVGRNSERGPSQFSLARLSLSRTWLLNPGKEVAAKDGMVTVPGPGGTMVQVPAALAGQSGPSGASKRKYNLSLNVDARNPLNHTTYTSPSGDLSSPFFGIYRTTSDGGTFNRQINLSLRLNF